VVEVFRPATLEEALAIRARTSAVPFAGGTDLMVRLRRGAGAVPGFTRSVLFLDRCTGLRGVTAGRDSIEIGAMTTLQDLAGSGLVHPALREAVLQMGGPALRTVATIGGNVCNASPAGDTIPFLCCFEARIRLASESGERTVAIADFITGPGKTCLRPDEILRSIVVPGWTPDRYLWRKVGTRKANALTKVSIAAFAELSRGRIARVRIALGAVGPTVVRLKDVEGMLESAARRGIPGTGPRVREASAAAVRPIDDQRSTAEYRRAVAAGLVESFALGLARP
jgi:CO/xanthine dehydrogenase FAD-binding subunit